MGTENTIKDATKKDKRSKRKSLEEARIKSKKAQTTPIAVNETEEEPKRKRQKKKNESIKGEDVENDVDEPSLEFHNFEETIQKPRKTKTTTPNSTAEISNVSISAPHKLTSAKTSTMPQRSKKSKNAKAKEPSVSPEPSSSDGEAAVDDPGDDDDVHLHGFSTDDDDSSDEDDIDLESTAFDVGKLPTVAKDDVVVKQKLDRAKRQPTGDRGVLFLGRLPHGFYEDQIKAYFTQFGTVTRVRLSRNKKTGRSKHYGFVEFDSSSVAQIVAETMDNYLIMGHILRCKVIPNDQVHPELWVGANRKWRPVPLGRITRVEHNKPRTEDEQKRAAKRLIKRQNDRKRKLAETGIKYNFETVGYKKPREGKI